MEKKEAMKILKDFHDESALFSVRTALETLHPELKESEDERMVNQLHSWMNEFGGAEEYTEKVYQWLKGLIEKQGTSYTKKDVDDAYVEGMAFTKDKPEKQGEHKSTLSKEDEKMREAAIAFVEASDHFGYHLGISKENVLDWLEKQGKKLPVGFYYVNSEGKKFYSDTFKYGDVTLHVEKQDEQKSTDEPKFKVGDWIIRNAEGFKHNTYLITEVKDYYICEELKGRRVTFTFNDVHKNFKLWDISDAKDGDVLAEDTCIFIIKKLNHDLSAEIYCCLYDDGDFDINSTLVFDDTCTYPATKEQRDILFQKMKERGYEWDAEKKKLKNIHVIDEGKAEMDYCFTKMMNGEKVSSTWSKEDEEIINSITSYLCTHDSCELDGFNKWYDFLKSLKERYTWKPSDDQMKALADSLSLAKNCGEEIAFDLRTLYEQLKKLKE